MTATLVAVAVIVTAAAATAAAFSQFFRRRDAAEFDRLGNGQKVPCEDMAQILDKPKYEGSYEQIGKAMQSAVIGKVSKDD